MFESLRARLEQLLAQHTAPADARQSAAQLHQAVIEAKVAVSQMREGLARSERELDAERTRLQDAERRGQLAGEINDEETVAVARRFADRHRSRVEVLERKVPVQRDELLMAEQELSEMTTMLRSARQGLGQAASSAEAAWRDLSAAGGERPETDLKDELLKSRFDRAASEAAAEAQLAFLKKKMGKDPGK